VSSVAIVPLGLTRYLKDERLTPVTPEFCRSTIDQMAVIQKDLRTRLGSTFAFLGDEIYLRAGADVPSRRHYGDYPQIEDGVGMVQSFSKQFESLMRKLDRKKAPGESSSQTFFGTIMTGTLFAPVLQSLVGRLNERFGTRLHVLAVENEYFGGDVSVAGLLTGSDFARARAGVKGEFAVIPRVSLKSDEPVMLDGMRFEELQSQFRVPLHAFDFMGFSRLLTDSY
jgi:NifB/MoaA-like Fe-S oxidoreductase